MDTTICPNCEEERKYLDMAETRCGHSVCIYCVNHEVVSTCSICGTGLVELLEIPRLSAFKDAYGSLLYDLLWYQSVSKAQEEESESDWRIGELCACALSTVFSTMIVDEGEEEERELGVGLGDFLEQYFNDIQGLLDPKYAKPGPKPSRR